MYGIYLECDKCGNTIGGEEVTPRQQGVPTLTRHDGDRLRQLAADLGWTQPCEHCDHCPQCSNGAPA